MSLVRRDDTVTNTLGNAISGAKVTYLTQPSNIPALTPLAIVYSDTVGTVAANPQITDGFGHSVAYLTAGVLYTIVYAYPNGIQVVYTDQLVGSNSGGVSPFAAIPTGVIDGSNQVFTISQVLNQATVWNNFPLVPGVGYTIVIGGSGMIITYAVAPQTGDSLYVQGF